MLLLLFLTHISSNIGDELFSDAYPMKLVDDLYYEVDGKTITVSNDVDASLLGANIGSTGSAGTSAPPSVGKGTPRGRLSGTWSGGSGAPVSSGAADWAREHSWFPVWGCASSLAGAGTGSSTGLAGRLAGAFGERALNL